MHKQLTEEEIRQIEDEPIGADDWAESDNWNRCPSHEGDDHMWDDSEELEYDD